MSDLAITSRVLDPAPDVTCLPTYVLVTPARNEEEFIELALTSVSRQTVPPKKWVIVSDGSTDGTDALVRKYAERYPWIELISLPEREGRHFAGKVRALNAGYEWLRDVQSEVIACMDADISFDPEYFEFLLGKLASDPSLGLVGTPFCETSGETYDYRFVSLEHVSGACQVFRRECFNMIGGYRPIRGGSVDHVAVITARMNGWNTRTFPEKICTHHRTMGTAEAGTMRARFRYGIKDHAIGNSPLWEIFRCIYQMSKRPYLVGGLALGLGYLWACLRGSAWVVSPELVSFHRKEQIERLKQHLHISGKQLKETEWRA